MQISCVNYNKLDHGTRLDAEYYRPEFLEVEKLLRKVNCKLLDDVSRSIKSFGAYALCNEMVLVDKGIPFIRCKDIKEGFVDFSDVLFIDYKTHRLLNKSAVTPEIVMLTMSGTVGNCAIADPAWNYPINSNQDIAKIETNDLINPYYLTVFLNGKYGKSQTERLPIGSIQQHIFIWQLKRLLVFIASKDFQNTIAKLYAKSIKSLVGSEAIYKKAEDALLSELGLLNWKPKHRLSFVKKFSESQDASRIDAEYFQPKYDEVVDHIKQYKKGYKPLAEIVKVKDQNFQPKDDVTYRYIELANISANGNINGFIETLGKELPTRARRKVNDGDVIVSTIEGSLSSIALIIKDFDNALCSTGFFVINSEEINSETLLVLLKSPVGQLQLKKGCSGTILTAIGDDEFKRIILPVLPAGIQKDIKKKITEMYNAKAISKHLLNIAKCGVEIAIERNETTAKKWILREVNKIGVSLNA
ncbi:MAG TPA: restriction endonuclease subunit S [Smithellaceae bacterium]|nr:restriction endonuclease subunit S [Smithellaceae bacterium]